MRYYVYIYYDLNKPGHYQYGKYSFKYEPFYIGKGTGYRYSKLKKLLESDLPRAKRSKKYADGKKLECMIYKNKLSQQDALDLEDKMIIKIGRILDESGPLINIATTNAPYNLSDASREACSIRMKELWENPDYRKMQIEKHKNQVVTEEHKFKLHLAHIGRPKSKSHIESMKDRIMKETTKAKISQSQMNHIVEQETRDKIAKSLSKGVIQLKDGIEIARFESITIAAQKIGISLSGIAKCCKGKRKSAGHFNWKFI